jgi:hypothetical protein
MKILKARLNVVSLSAILLTTRAAALEPSMTTILRDGTVIATLHAEGAQVYECMADGGRPQSDSRVLTWQFREPIATLIVDGKSIGRHYAGPNWEYADGSAVNGKVMAANLAQFFEPILTFVRDEVGPSLNPAPLQCNFDHSFFLHGSLSPSGHLQPHSPNLPC